MAKIEDFKSIHELITKIGDKADELNWPELVEEISSAYDKYENETQFDRIFFELHQYLLRLWLRIRDFGDKRPIDKVVELNSVYTVYGYSLQTFLYARNHQDVVVGITNERIEFDKDKLSDAAKASFDKKIADS